MPLVSEDKYHPSMSIDIISTSNLPSYNPSQSFFNFHKADNLRFKEFLSSFNWSETFINLDANLPMSIFYDASHFSIMKWVPRVNYSKSNFPSWFKGLIDLVSLKRRADAILKLSLSLLIIENFLCFVLSINKCSPFCGNQNSIFSSNRFNLCRENTFYFSEVLFCDL